MEIKKQSLALHKKLKGKIEVKSRMPLNTKEDLALCYTPGVAAPCLKIQQNEDLSYEYTRRGNLVAVITDSTAVLGLGDIGTLAGMPVMEGKCMLFKEFADIDAFPLCIKSKDTDEIVRTISLISGSFGGINLEDIAAPRCFEIERKLQEVCDIPVFHDDQHGTAVVVAAALINAAKLVKKSLSEVKIIINGAGSAGIAIAKHLLSLGCKNTILCDLKGIIAKDNEWQNEAQNKIAALTNPENMHGTLYDAIKSSDVFIGVSAPDILTEAMVKSMNHDSIVFAMANPVPEINPGKAKEWGVRVVGTGRSDYDNQINNVLAFPGIFRGALDSRASVINDEMKTAASYAIASLVKDSELNENYIIPSPLDKSVAKAVAKSVAEAAVISGVSKL